MIIHAKQSGEAAQVRAQQMDGDAAILHVGQRAFQHIWETIDEHEEHLPFLLFEREMNEYRESVANWPPCRSGRTSSLSRVKSI